MIRRRLVVAVSATAAVAVVLAGWLSLLALEARLVDNLDRDFERGTLAREVRELLARPRFGLDRPTARFDAVQRVAVVVYGPDGAVLGSVPTGTDDDPDPLPDGASLRPGTGLHTVPSVHDDGPDYRAAGLALGEGRRAVVAVSLAGVTETLADTRRILAAIGVVAIGVIGASTWLLIRRGLAPIDHLVATAGRISGGDLTERTGLDDDASEVGHLASALDQMMDRIEEAVAARAASEQRMRDFVAEASHELRTPLTSVRGYAELFRHREDDPEIAAEAMSRIEDAASRMQRLVDQLLLLARLDRDDVSGEPRSHVDLATVVGDAVDAARVVDGDRVWDLELPAEPVPVTAEGDQLRQVVDNLLGNARRHTPPGTTVSTALRVAATTASLTVSDDGPGIPPADRSRVFDRFWRGTRTDENPVDGTGLGLAIVDSIVRAHGGTVTVSEAPGGGASFTINLPLAPRRRGSPAL